jgi:hypothetical protein
VTEAAKGINPHFREGFVVCDHRFNRLKVRVCPNVKRVRWNLNVCVWVCVSGTRDMQIKSPMYVALAHLTRKDKSALNKRRMLDIVRHNEGGEFLTYFPQWTSLYNQVKERYTHDTRVRMLFRGERLLDHRSCVRGDGAERGACAGSMSFATRRRAPGKS